jgi:threonine dehydratase
MSAGNHAQGLAHHATRLGIPSTIVMPSSTPNTKVAGTEALGAQVVLHGETLAESMVLAKSMAAERGLVWVPPYDDPAIIAGQGTVALELLEDAPEVDTIVVPVGGGGLIAGMAVAAHTMAPDVRIVGVESERYPCMVNAVEGADLPVGGSTVAEGIAVADAGTLTAPIVAALVGEVLVVGERDIEHAINLFLDIEKTVAEGAGAAPLAAVLTRPERFVGRKVALVLTGGNIDARVLANVILRGLVRSGRLSRISVDITDSPGSLAGVTRIVGEEGGNIVEVGHQRLFSDIGIKDAVLELAIETRDRQHIEHLVAALEAGGYVVTRGVHP